MTITAPVGMNDLQAYVSRICANAPVYQWGRKPSHLIVPLDSGSGRTTFIRYMSAMFKKNHILNFYGSLDPYIELDLDGSSSRSIAQGFDAFRDGSDYANSYQAVAAISTGSMARYLTAPQMADFLREIRELSSSACVVFFTSGNPTPAEEKLIGKIQDAVPNIVRINPIFYTREELCQILMRYLDDQGFLFEDNESFFQALLPVCEKNDLTTVPQALELADRLRDHADFSGVCPILTADALTALTGAQARKEL